MPYHFIDETFYIFSVMGLQDDIAYVCILLGSIGFGKIFRMIPARVENGVKTFETRKLVVLDYLCIS